MYAVATGEVRQLSGVNFERDRERRVADHHSNEVDPMATATGKNSQYYELLHENTTWKLSECMREKPFVSLSPTIKAQILAHLCNDLLMNKAVLKQIDGSLESAAQTKKDRYVLDAKIRKYRSIHARKVRMSVLLAEAAKLKEEELNRQALAQQQAAAAALAAAEEANKVETMLTNGPNDSNVIENLEELKTEVKSDNSMLDSNGRLDEDGVDVETENAASKISGEMEEDIELKTPKKSISSMDETDNVNCSDTTMMSKENKSPPPSLDNKTAEDTAIKETATPPSAQIDQSRLKKEEVSTSLNEPTLMNSTAPILNSSMINKSMNITENGADGMDDELSDIEPDDIQMVEDEDERLSIDELAKKLDKLDKQQNQARDVLDSSMKQLRGLSYGQDRYWRRYWTLPKAGGIFVEGLESGQAEILKYHEALERHYGTVKRETKEEEKDRLIKSEDEDEDDDDGDEEEESGDEIKADNVVKCENSDDDKDHEDDQQTEDVEMVDNSKNNNDEHDIEDSIPTAILVQKANGTVETTIKEEKEQMNQKGLNEQIVKIEQEPMHVDSEDCNPVVKMEEMKQESQEKQSFKYEDSKDVILVEDGDDIKEEEKWFSLINKELPLDSIEFPACFASQLIYNNITCESLIQIQGNPWDIANNLQYFNSPSDMREVEFFKSLDSILTPSGLNEAIMSKVMTAENIEDVLQKVIEEEKLKGTVKNSEETSAQGFSIPPFLNLSLHNVTNYVQCDNFTPLHMTAEEQRMLEEIKTNGWPKKVRDAFVSRDLRHGWWKISDKDLVTSILQVLHIRGVREKDLRTNLLLALQEEVDFAAGSQFGPLDSSETIPDADYVDPTTLVMYNPKISERVEMSLLEQIEVLEDKIASASMQVKGWAIPPRENEGQSIDHSITALKERVLGLEAAIERRYLKPPLGNNVGEVNLAALAQNQDANTLPVSSQQSNCSDQTDDSYEHENVSKGRLIK